MDDFPITSQMEFHLPLAFHSLYTKLPPKTTRPHTMRLHHGKLEQNYIRMSGICRKENLQTGISGESPVTLSVFFFLLWESVQVLPHLGGLLQGVTASQMKVTAVLLRAHCSITIAVAAQVHEYTCSHLFKEWILWYVSYPVERFLWATPS